MRTLNKMVSLVSLAISFIFAFTLIFIKPSSTVLFAVVIGILASMFVTFITHGIIWFLYMQMEKKQVRIQYTNTLDNIGDLHQLIDHTSKQSSIVALKQALVIYDKLFREIQSIYIMHFRDKMFDYFKLKDTVNEMSIEMKKINKHRIIQRDDQYITVFKDVVKFVENSKYFKEFTDKVILLQDKSIVEQNKRVKEQGK